MKLVIKDGVIYPNQFFKFVTVGYIFAVGTYTLLLALVVSVFYVVHNSLYQETSFEIFSDLGIPLPVVFLIFCGRYTRKCSPVRRNRLWWLVVVQKTYQGERIQGYNDQLIPIRQTLLTTADGRGQDRTTSQQGEFVSIPSNTRPARP